MTQKQEFAKRESTRGSHKRTSVQSRMDLDIPSGTTPSPVPDGRIKDETILIFASDYGKSSKAICEWIMESSDALIHYFTMPSKFKSKNFVDGLKHFRNMLLSDLAFGGDKILEDTILEDLEPLVTTGD